MSILPPRQGETNPNYSIKCAT